METRLKSTSGRIAFFAVMAALTTIANLIMVPMPQPLAEYDLSPVLMYTLGVTVDPVTAAIIVATAMMLGTGYKVMSFGFPIVFVPGAMLVRGLEAALISVIVRMKPPAETKTVTTWEILAMVVGVLRNHGILRAGLVPFRVGDSLDSSTHHRGRGVHPSRHRSDSGCQG